MEIRRKRAPPKVRSPADNPKILEEMRAEYDRLAEQGLRKYSIYKLLTERFGFRSLSSIRYWLEPDVRASQISIRKLYSRHKGTQLEKAADRDYKYLKRHFPKLLQMAIIGVDYPITASEISDRLIQVLADAGRPNLSYVRGRTIEKLVEKYELNTGQKVLERVDYNDTPKYKLKE